MEPFLRWAGSKRQLLPILEGYWSDRFSRYIEPFAGSSCLFFHLEPRAAILGDLNADLISTMRAIRRDVYRVTECLRRLRDSKKSYYKIRAQDPHQLGLFEQAARFLYLNARCFNGLYRTNSKGQFNVPYCPPGHNTNKEEILLQAAEALKRATLLHEDFETTVASAGKGDFVYLDPPYAVTTRRVFSQYGPKVFEIGDLGRVAKCLDSLDARGAKFVLSYADCKTARLQFKKWHITRVWTRRNIAGFTGFRRGSYELLATNSLN